MDPNKQPVYTGVQSLLDKVAAHNPDTLAERPELGTINFKNGKSVLEQAVLLAKELKSLPLDLLPTVALSQLNSPLNTMANTLDQIAAFKIEQANPAQTRDSLQVNAQQHYDQLLVAAMPFLPYLTLKSAQVQDTVRRASELLVETERRVTTVLSEVEQKKSDIDAIVRAARDAAAKIGVAQFATRFEETAQGHEDAAKRWFWGTAGLAALTAAAAILFLFLLPPLGQLAEAASIQRIITKLVVISILYVATVWAARNYRAQKHLWVVNKHRQNALATFQTFVEAAKGDEPTKNAVLLEATRCVFAPAVTGYLEIQEESPSNRIVEIFKTASGNAGPAS